MLPRVSAAIIKFLTPIHSHRTNRSDLALLLRPHEIQDQEKKQNQKKPDLFKKNEKKNLKKESDPPITDGDLSSVMKLLMMVRSKPLDQKKIEGSNAYQKVAHSRSKQGLFNKGIMLDDEKD